MWAPHVPPLEPSTTRMSWLAIVVIVVVFLAPLPVPGVMESATLPFFVIWTLQFLFHFASLEYVIVRDAFAFI